VTGGHHHLGADRAGQKGTTTMKTLETKSVVLLRHHLKALRLPTVGAECEKVAAQAAADNVDHLTYLLQLLELELLDREKRSAERRLKAARFPTIKTLDAFDFSARPSVNKVLVAELARCEYIDKRENVLMVGNPGTGKSHCEAGDPPVHPGQEPGLVLVVRRDSKTHCRRDSDWPCFGYVR
jgi:hypothetical protein